MREDFLRSQVKGTYKCLELGKYRVVSGSKTDQGIVKVAPVAVWKTVFRTFRCKSHYFIADQLFHGWLLSPPVADYLLNAVEHAHAPEAVTAGDSNG